MNPSIPVTAITDLLALMPEVRAALRQYDDHHLATKVGIAEARLRGTLDEVAPKVELRPAA